MAYSQPINIIRYSNGTLVRLTGSAEEFQSYDYNAETGVGTFTPDSIVITADYQGDLSYGKWQYSTDGKTFVNAVNNQHGMTFTAAQLTIAATSDLFTTKNSSIVIKCVANDNVHYDTYTVLRTVDAITVYRDQYTNIKQNRDKIALIASDEQLRQFATSQTMWKQVSEFEQSAGRFQQTVEETYATKSYADSKATAAKNDANANTANVLTNYSTTTQTANAISTAVSSKVGNNEIISRINQTAETIKIQAAKIALEGLVTLNNYFKILTDGTFQANKGDIGNIHVVTDAIYSGQHNVATSANGGFFLGSDGTVGIGNGNEYIRFRKVDGSWKIEIKVASLAIGSSTAATASQVTSAKTTTSTELWYCSNSEARPSKPTAHVSADEETGYNKWNVAKPKGTGAYKYYFHCIEIQYADGSYAWTSVQRDYTSQNLRENAVEAANKKVVGTQAIYYVSTSATAPALPSAAVTVGTSDRYNAWSLAYPKINNPGTQHVHIAFQIRYNDGTYTWYRQGEDYSVVDAKKTASNAQSTANTANSNATEAKNKKTSAVVDLWYCSSSTTAPAKPTVHVTTNNVATNGAWNLAKPTGNSTYKYYFHCTELIYADSTYGWSDVTRDDSITAAKDSATMAAGTANNYLYYDSTNGLVVSENGKVDGDADHPLNIQLMAGGINFRRRTSILASITGAELTFYRGTSGTAGMILNSSNILFKDKSGTTVASIGDSGLDVKHASMGRFHVEDDNNTGTTSDGGHMYNSSLYAHGTHGSYEYEVGLSGGAYYNSPCMYVGRIASGAKWNTASLLTYINKEGLLYSIKAKLGNWEFDDYTMSSGKLVLSSAHTANRYRWVEDDDAETIDLDTGEPINEWEDRVEQTIADDPNAVYDERTSIGGYYEINGTASSPAQIILGNFNSEGNIGRKTAYLDSEGNLSSGFGAFNKIKCGDTMIDPDDDDELSSDVWSFFANKNKVRVAKPFYIDNTTTTSSGSTMRLHNNRVYRQSSSRRYKDIDRPLTAEDVNRFYDLNVYRAKYKDGVLDKDDPGVGKYMPMFIAEEVDDILPEAAVRESGLVEDWNDRVMIPVMFQMIKDQKAEIDALKQELETIKQMLMEGKK